MGGKQTSSGLVIHIVGSGLVIHIVGNGLVIHIVGSGLVIHIVLQVPTWKSEFFLHFLKTVFASFSDIMCSPHRTVAAAFEWISWYTTTVMAFNDLEDSVKPLAFLKVWFLLLN